jgi:hypothetical protein
MFGSASGSRGSIVAHAPSSKAIVIPAKAGIQGRRATSVRTAPGFAPARE